MKHIKTFENLHTQNIDEELVEFIINRLIEDFENNTEQLKTILMKIHKGLLIGALPESDHKYTTYSNKLDVVDALTTELYSDHEYGDYTVLEELLGFLTDEELLNTLTSEEREKYIISKSANKYNL